jgi:hypothetical protein
MQRVGVWEAEVSCIKLQSRTNGNGNGNGNLYVHTPDYDVEKATINPSARPSANKPVPETQKPSDCNEETVVQPSESSSSSTQQPVTEIHPPPDQNGHTDDEKDDFPEGGRGWLVCFGAFCGSFSVFGIINSTGVLLDYFSTHQLKDYTSSQIGWIFGLSLFLTFFCGAPIGPLFDAYGPRALILCGSILLVASMFLLGLCTRESSRLTSASPC